MPDPSRIELAARAAPGLVHVIIDTPQASRAKFKYDTATGLFKLSRLLPRGMHFPNDFGFIPGTCAADGDALDVLVLSDVASFVGCLMTVRLIGVLEGQQSEGRRKVRNDRLIAVPRTPVNEPLLRRLRDIPRPLLDEIESFFVNYNRVQGRIFQPLRRSGPAAAESLLDQAIRAFDMRGSK